MIRTDPWEFIGLLADTAAERRALVRKATAARRRTPEAKAVRVAAAKRGWETRRAQAAAEDTAWKAEQERDTGPIVTGPVCDQMTHNSIGSEVFCLLDPDHDPDTLCDDLNGTTWNSER